MVLSKAEKRRVEELTISISRSWFTGDEIDLRDVRELGMLRRKRAAQTEQFTGAANEKDAKGDGIQTR